MAFDDYRHMVMKRRALLIVPMITLIAALAGCAHSSGPSRGPNPSAPTRTSGCPLNLVVTAADGGRTLCVTKGGTVTVDLGSSATSPFDVSGTALDPGPTRGTFAATGMGTATVSTQRNVCPPPSPGQMSCHSIQLWQVTIQVKA